MNVSWLSWPFWLSCIFPQIDGSKGKTEFVLKLRTSERVSEVLSDRPSYNSSAEPTQGHVKHWSAPSSAKPPEASSEREIWQDWVDPGFWNLLGKESTVEEPGIEGSLEYCFLPWHLENICSCTGGEILSY